ncbi:hypothetical protein FRB95_004356 [Tulasnella sp. JGI-2019a]|nr:hypothetical protein FRB95_004356 [Tulasnella sp. JGI-2019a]
MSGEPFEIKLTHMVAKDQLVFSSAERRTMKAILERTPDTVTHGAGLVAEAELDSDECFVDSAEGTIKFTRVWAKMGKDETLQELFEGFFSFDVEFSRVYARKGFEASANHDIAFWAIRARKDAKGKEIGLSP